MRSLPAGVGLEPLEVHLASLGRGRHLRGRRLRGRRRLGRRRRVARRGRRRRARLSRRARTPHLGEELRVRGERGLPDPLLGTPQELEVAGAVDVDDRGAAIEPERSLEERHAQGARAHLEALAREVVDLEGPRVLRELGELLLDPGARVARPGVGRDLLPLRDALRPHVELAPVGEREDDARVALAQHARHVGDPRGERHGDEVGRAREGVRSHGLGQRREELGLLVEPVSGEVEVVAPVDRAGQVGCLGELAARDEPARLVERALLGARELGGSLGIPPHGWRRRSRRRRRTSRRRRRRRLIPLHDLGVLLGGLVPRDAHFAVTEHFPEDDAGDDDDRADDGGDTHTLQHNRTRLVVRVAHAGMGFRSARCQAAACLPRRPRTRPARAAACIALT